MRLKWNRLLVFPLIITILGAWLLWPHAKPDAGWFDDNWIYRVAISIGNTGSADGNKKVKLDIDTSTLITANKMQSDCGDSRFTDAAGKLLKYYIDTAGGACNTNSTDYYVLMPSIPAGGSIIYHYYGNSTAANGTEAAQFSQSTFSPNSGPTAASEEQTVGPVLSWSMNENNGSTLNDDTLNANSGTLGTTTSAPTWTASDLCVNGSCLKFDGSNDYVSKSYSSDTELDPGTAGFSVSAWFKHTSIQAGTDVIISRVDGADANGVGYKIYMDSSGYICFGIDQSAGSFPANSACTTTSYADSQWHYVSGVKDTATTKIYLYIDGKQITETAYTAGSLSGSSPAFRLGIENGFANPWDGFIDSVKVYPYARSADQVKIDFNSRGSVKGAGVSMGNSDMNKNLSTGLVGYWKMDETSTPNNDFSGNSHSASWSGDTTYGVGKFGNGAHFDGNDDYTLSSDTFDLSGDQTYSIWVKPSLVTGNLKGVFAKHNHSVNANLGINLYNNFRVSIGYQDETREYADKATNFNATVGEWVHVVLVYKSKGNRVEFYINGTFDKGWDLTKAVKFTSDKVLFGQWSTAYLNQYEFQGDLDEARLYNRALSPSEISALYNYAPGPVAKWNMDEGTGSSIIDSSGNQNNGAFTVAPSWDSGKFGKGLSFNGSNNSAYIADNDKLTSQNFTLGAWVQLLAAGDSDSGEIIAKGSHGTGEYSIRLSRVAFYCDVNGNNTNSANALTLDKNWHYIACTYDSSNIRFYIDGILVKTIALSTTISNSSYDVTIGEDGLGGFDFTGKIDDVSIYNYTRSPAQVIEDMNGGHPIGGSPIGSQVGYWQFDEGALNTCSGGTNDFCDVSINANDLVFSGTSGGITLSGKYGAAFDGNAAQWASRADDDDFDFAAADDFTLTAWIKSDGTASGTQYILNKSSATSQGYGIYGSSSGKVVFAIDDDTSWTPDDQAQSTTNVFDQAWHYIAARKTGTSKIDIFVDGRLEGSNTSLGATSSLSNAVSLYIGDRDGTDNGDEFNGDIDEVKIYRGALTDDQIKLDYNQGQSTVMGVVSTASNGITADNSSARAFCVPGDTSTCNAPVGWFKMDEGNGTTTVIDSSGNNNIGSMNGSMTQADWVAGKIGKGLDFDGTNDYILVTNPSSLSNLPPNNFSASAWIKLKSLPGVNNGEIIAGKSRNDDHIWHFGVVNISGTVYFDSSLKNNAISRATGVTTGVWYHFYITYNNSTDRKIHMYINGAEVTYTTQSAFSGVYGTDTTYDGNNDFIIGAHKTNTSNFNGTIDDVKIYNYVRTPAQIAWDYNNGGPVAWYQFDECQGTTAYDSSPNLTENTTGNNGTITIGATGSNTSAGTCTGAATAAWKNGANGKFNSSLSFDGTNDSVDLGDNYDFTGNVPFSISAWIKPASVPSAAGRIVSKYNFGTSGQWYLDINGLSQIDFLRECGSYGTTSVSSVPLNSWTHVVGVYNGSDLLIYKNGILDKTKTDSCAISDTSTHTIIGAGDDATPNTEYNFNGQIDDVRIFNYALTPLQIKTIMNNGSSVNFTPITGSP